MIVGMAAGEAVITGGVAGTNVMPDTGRRPAETSHQRRKSYSLRITSSQHDRIAPTGPLRATPCLRRAYYQKEADVSDPPHPSSRRCLLILLNFPLAALACQAGATLEAPSATAPPRTRAESIPADAVKMVPETDPHPPVLQAAGWDAPVPLPAPVNTGGAEDGPFITSDGESLFFTFTPDPDVAAEEQLFDGVTGIYLSRRQAEGWSEPERVVLEGPGELALDGCPFLLGESLWFCSARQGNQRGVDLWTAQLHDGRWTGWASAGPRLNGDLQAGEMHLSADGSAMYYHADRPGGAGGLDLWVTRLMDGDWGEPENLVLVNSPADDSRPALSPDGTELWFTRTVDGAPAILRSVLDGAAWSAPELIVWPFAAEPSLDPAGNLYFAHHFIVDGRIADADIYVARRR